MRQVAINERFRYIDLGICIKPLLKSSGSRPRINIDQSLVDSNGFVVITLNYFLRQ